MTRKEVVYRALADKLLAIVESLPPGSRIPGELELAAEHGVSRPTARSALQELEQRHLIRRIRGAGTYVIPRIDYVVSPTLTPSWSDSIRRAGGTPGFRETTIDRPRADRALRGELALPESAASAWRIRRVGTVDGFVASLLTNYVPVDLVPDLRNRYAQTGSLYETWRQVGLEPARLWSRTEFAQTDHDVAELLELEAGGTMIWRGVSCVIDRAGGRRIGYATTWSRPDIFRYIFEYGAEA